MKRIIYILGTDGSGKTTLAKGLVNKFNEKGKRVKYIYARHIPIIIFPIKILSKIILYRQNSEFKNYKKYSEIKYGFSKKHRLFAKIYAALWVLDYLIFSGIKIYIGLLFSSYIIIDRYVADVVVNISIASQLTDSESELLLNFFHIFFPKPDICFFINVDEEVAFQRKNDIQSIQYLKERKVRYFGLQDYYKFIVINGHLSKDEILLDVFNRIRLN